MFGLDCWIVGAIALCVGWLTPRPAIVKNAWDWIKNKVSGK